MNSENSKPTNVGSNDQLGPVAEALKRAYYYTELGGWRGPEVEDAERWLSVATVAFALVAAEHERKKPLTDEQLMAAITEGMRDPFLMRLTRQQVHEFARAIERAHGIVA